MIDYEVVYSAALEREAVRAAQRTASQKPQPSPADPRALVLTYLRRHPASTMREIHEGTGLSMQHVNSHLYLLQQRGQITRSHARQDNRGVPVRWTVSREYEQPGIATLLIATTTR
jgi:predicted Rossmann fold nucleotide-binding protein DprA/Smf involved in DNA uptake